MSRVSLRWAVLGVLALAPGCSGAQQAPGTSEPSPVKVRMAVGGQAQLIYLPATLAQELGYYKDEHLDVTIEDFPGGAKALEALMGGSAEVVCGFFDHTMQMAAEGRNLISFATILRYPGLVLLVSPAASSKRIQRIEDLKGAVVGVTSPGSSTHMFVNHLLLQHGLKPDDVSITGVGGGPTFVAALEHGKIDAGVTTDPAVTYLLKRNPRIAILADVRTSDGVREAFGTTTYPASVFYAPGDWVDKNRDTAGKLARAMVRTLRWMHEHSVDEIAQKVPATFRGEDQAAYVEALTHAMPMYSLDGQMSAEGAEAVRGVLSQSNEKVRNAKIDVAAHYTNEFLR